MKAILISCCFGIGISLSGCTVAETSADDVGRQFQQGMQGGGQIVPNNPTTDSFGSDYN